MRMRVTAVVVAQDGGEFLEETIAGIAGQTRLPNAVVAVNNGDQGRVTEQLVAGGVTQVVGLASRQPFGRAVQHGLDAVAADDVAAENDWVWLLAEDSCPEPEALERIVNVVRRAQTVAVAGPKLVDWDHPERIIELGQSLTRYGARWTLRRQELDQQQYDHLQDVLGVGPVGMLVRRDVWDQLGGFDPALPVYDDALDFCVRARLAGHRVEVAPASRVRFARTGIAGPRIDRKRSAMRRAHRQARASHLHRRLAYAPALVAPFEWLALPVYAVLRLLWALVRGQPGNMLGEFVGTLSVFFNPHRILASRRRIKAHLTDAGWSVVRPLRVDPKTVRTARMIDREAILVAQGRQPKELHFVSSGGLAVLSGSLVAALLLTWWAIPQTSLVGGGLAPLSPIAELWRNTHTLDGVPADPFTWVLAVLGSLTFWDPSHAIVLLIILAIPATALGAWIWAGQLTDSKPARALVGIGFGLSPALLGSLSEGRLTTLILTIVLPWLLVAATRCRESWSWAGTASLLAAVALACAPVLIPGAALLLVVGILTNVRGAARALSTAIVPAVLFAPKVISELSAGTPLSILMDPGINPEYEPGTVWHTLLGFPEFGLHGWANILSGIGLGAPPATLLVGLLLLPIALLALLGVFTGRVTITLFSSLLGGVGVATALASAQLSLGLSGADAVPLWAGSGLAVYWLAVLTLAAVGAELLRAAAGPVVGVALIAALVAVAPVGVRLATNQAGFESAEAQMPALVRADGAANPSVRTVVIEAEASHSVRAELVTGQGVRLDEVRTAAVTSEVTEQDRMLAELVGGLASLGGADITDQLRDQQVSYVLLSHGGDEVERASLQRAFDQHGALEVAGTTDQGLLWRVVDAVGGSADIGDTEQNLTGSSVAGTTIWAVQLAVLLGMLLLALPTAEVVERPAPRAKRRAKKTRTVATQSEGPLLQLGEPAESLPVEAHTATAIDTVNPDAAVGSDAVEGEAEGAR